MSRDVHYMKACVYLVFEKGNKILVGRRMNTGYHDGDYSVPFGDLVEGEPASGAAIREATEEVGIHLRMAELRLAHVMHRFSNTGSDYYIDFYFFVTNFPGEATNIKQDKWTDWKWVPWNALPTNTIPQVRYALECIKADKIYSEFNFIN